MFWAFFYFKYRNRCHTWRLSRTMHKLPEKRLEDSGPRWKPFKSSCCLFIFWLCKTSSHLTKNNTCFQSNINDGTFSACLNAWRASEQKPNTAFILFPAAAAWMCCCRAREPRWSPWSQTWASVRRQWSSSPSTASLSRSKLFRGLASLPLSTTSLFYCFLLLLKRVRQSERFAEVFKRHVWEAEARSAQLKQQGSCVFLSRCAQMKCFISV